jgi:enoyl-[acyl-carrier protein] reductase I
MGVLEGKTGIIYGVANKRSIAWGIAQAADDAGAELVLTYIPRMEADVRKLAATLSRPPLLVECDVQNDDQIAEVYRQVGERHPRLDFVAHCVAFANRADLDGRFIDTSREGFRAALEVSAFSLTAVTRGALPLMTEGGSVITLTYLGSERAMPSYNVMGVAKAALEASVRYLASDLGGQKIRVNAVSAGPVQTLSARGIAGFTDFMRTAATQSPLKRNIEVAEVANTAVFLVSPGSSGITGQVIYVDAGYSIMGAGLVDS